MSMFSGKAVGGPLDGKTLTHQELIYSHDTQVIPDKSIQVYREQILSWVRYEYRFSEKDKLWCLV